MIGTAGVPYIGRAHHRATVAAAFAEPGHIVLVCGEAGVGKSSLVAAERAGATTEVIEGSCLQLAGQALPLAALEQVFYARGGWPAAPDDSVQLSPEQRLKAVRQWADALAPSGSGTTSTLVIDDLQWADETTCDFLVYLAEVSSYLLPHLRDRPLTAIRLPNGITGQRWFQRHAELHPDFLETVRR